MGIIDIYPRRGNNESIGNTHLPADASAFEPVSVECVVVVSPEDLVGNTFGGAVCFAS